MVTKLADGRGQITIKGHGVDAEWEALVKEAARRNGMTVADFVVHFTREAAQASLKGQSAVPAAVPARLEDVADALTKHVADLAQELRTQQAEALEGLRRDNRLVRVRRWRR